MLTQKEINLLFDLEKRWEFYRDLRGNKWQGIVADYEKYIRFHMKEDNCNVLAAALKLGKILVDGGNNPNELFAVAVEIIKREDNLNIAICSGGNPG